MHLSNFGDDQRADKFAIGYVYNLSKRTALYGSYGYISDRNGAGLTVGGPPDSPLTPCSRPR